MTMTCAHYRDRVPSYPSPLDPGLNDPFSPVWQSGGRVHNWLNYIGDHTRPLWASFSDEQKVALALDANHEAGREDWE